jgi:hypothetical protein
MGFEVFQKGSPPVPAVPTITMQKGGNFSLNRAAHALVGNPDAYELLWDRDARLVALRPATLESPNAYPARPQQASEPAKGPLILAASSFSQFVGLEISSGRRWNAQVKDGMLLIDLGDPGTPVVSNRVRGRNKTQDVQAW